MSNPLSRLVLRLLGGLALIVMFFLLALPSALANSPHANTIISIPTLNITSTVIEIPIVEQNGKLVWAYDPMETRVGHLEGTPWLGESGNIVLGAHSSTSDGKPGTFVSLPDVVIGDIIILTENDITYHYMVITTRTIDNTDLSILQSDSDQLTLLSCAGEYSLQQGDFLQRYVVIAVPVP